MNEKLADILTEASRYADEAAEALRRGDIEGAQRLQLEAQSSWLRVRRMSIRQVRKPTRVRSPTAREISVRVLTELGIPCSPKEIAAYAEAQTGEWFDVRSLASIRRDERRSWSAGTKRDTYLVPTLEGPWFVAGRGRFALSQWPLWQRIMGPLSPRADHLRACLQLAAQIEGSDPASNAAVRMRKLLALYARSIPGAIDAGWHSDAELDVPRVRVSAAQELALIETEDEESRKREAERAARQLDAEQQIWGGSMPQIIPLRSNSERQ